MKNRCGQRGGAALEYLIVSTCALMMGLAAMGFISNIFQEKLSELQETADSDWDQEWTDFQE